MVKPEDTKHKIFIVTEDFSISGVSFYKNQYLQISYGFKYIHIQKTASAYSSLSFPINTLNLLRVRALYKNEYNGFKNQLYM